ncbi:MAG: hypothetical protein K2X87_05530, partial [Gemmataceae bacterium]|nr:hypothetical protein [Gemmataceae bacterium]
MAITYGIGPARRLGPAAAAVLLVLTAAPSPAGVLVGTLDPVRFDNRDLTTEGTLDWAVWGYADGGTSTSLAADVRKAGGAGLSGLTDISNGNPLRGLGQFGAYGETTFDWSDGTPVPSEVGAFTGLQHDGQRTGISNLGEGFSLTAAADTAERVLTLYTTVNFGAGRLVATLSDGSAAAYDQTTSGSAFNQSNVFTIRYAADSPGQFLSVTFVLAEDDEPVFNSSNVAIQGASLAAAGPRAVPEPASLGLAA